MTARSPTLAVRARGPLACFTRPEMKAERFSYEVMTPSAARGILEAILWKPAISWQIERIHVLAPIRFVGFRRNEVAARIPAKGERSPAQGMAGKPMAPYFADEDRQQRSTIALRDVDYLIEAHFSFTAKAAEGDTIPKFVEMFQRRIDKGQTFHQPYLGCREFVCEVLPVVSRGDGYFDSATDERLLPESALRAERRRPLGCILLDIEFDRAGHGTPRFFEAELDEGVLVEAGRTSLPIRGGAR